MCIHMYAYDTQSPLACCSCAWHTLNQLRRFAPESMRRLATLRNENSASTWVRVPDQEARDWLVHDIMFLFVCFTAYLYILCCICLAGA